MATTWQGRVIGCGFALVTVLGLGDVGLAQRDTALSKADVEQLMQEVSNWGRWGDDDQLGAMNLITPDKRREAARLVQDGVSVSLAHDVDKQSSLDNPDPFVHQMLLDGQQEGQWSVDRYSVSYHGYAHTHMDALCHLFYNARMYNGYSRTEVGPLGAKKLSIHHLKNGIFTRAVLMDIPRLRGVDALEPGSAIYTEDLEAWENRIGTQVRPGDVVFIRTGRWARRAQRGPWEAELGSAGLHATCARWLKKRDVAILGSDAASDVLPSGVPGVSHPVHLLVLHAMGMNIFDNCDLEEVAKVCGEKRRWEFLVTASPLPVEGGTGSPLNPIATF